MISGLARLLALAPLLSLAVLPVSLPAASADTRYPATSEWTKAGVRGGPPADRPVLARVTPGNDIQAALEITAAQGGGVVELAAGEFVLTRTLRLPSGVVLRGSGDGESRLHVKLRSPAATVQPAAIQGTGIRGTGLERLAIVFDSSLPPPPGVLTAKQPFVNDPEGRNDLWVVGVRLTESQDCWMTGCRILNSGTHPLVIESSRHLTVRDCEFLGAHNKGEPDAGCVVVAGSEYVLFEVVSVRDLRHAVLTSRPGGPPCRNNVLVRSQFAVDVQLHGSGTTANLLSECTLDLPPGHPWTPFGIGNARRDQPPGPGNLIHGCRATHTFGNSKRNYSVAADPAQVYTLITDFKLEKKNPHHVVPFGPAPAGGTFHPIPSPRP